MAMQTPFDEEGEGLTLPRIRPGFPDGVMLLGETEDNRYLPLEVDGGDRLVLAVASLDYIPRTVQLLGTSAAVLEETTGYVIEVNIVNVSAGVVYVTLYYSSAVTPSGNEIIYQAGVTARLSNQIALTLEIGTKKLWAEASLANSLYALCSLHRGRDYVRP